MRADERERVNIMITQAEQHVFLFRNNSLNHHVLLSIWIKNKKLYIKIINTFVPFIMLKK